jgi:hypothetical protein
MKHRLSFFKHIFPFIEEDVTEISIEPLKNDNFILPKRFARCIDCFQDKADNTFLRDL